MEVKEVDITKLNIPEYNVRCDESRTEVTSLVKSITETGLIEPLIVRPNGEKFDIVSGSRRYMALKSMSRTIVPCIIEDISEKEASLQYLQYNVEQKRLNPIEIAKTIRYNIEQNVSGIEEFTSKEYYQKMYLLLDLPLVLQRRIERNEVKYTKFLPLLNLELYKEWRKTKDDDLQKDNLRESYIALMNKIWTDAQNTDESLKTEIDKKVKLQNYLYLAKKTDMNKALKKPQEELAKATDKLKDTINESKEKLDISFEIYTKENLQTNAERFLRILKEKSDVKEDKFIDKSEIYHAQIRIKVRQSFLKDHAIHNFKHCVCGAKFDRNEINAYIKEDIQKIEELRQKEREKGTKTNILHDCYRSFTLNLKNYNSAKERYDELYHYYVE